MSKERYNQIIDEAYENYRDKLLFNEIDCYCDTELNKPNKTFIPYNQEEFINKCKTDSEFSEKWGLKIEERELSLEERNDVYKKQWEPGTSELSHDRFNSLNIPTKLITITYNGTKIESYE